MMGTFSIVAHDPAQGDWGIAVQSKFLAVGAVVPWARAGVGAIATQSYANTSYGPEGLRLLAAGVSAEEALARLVAADEGREHRQVGIVDAAGSAAAFTGGECLAWAGHRIGSNYACQGNILVSAATVEAMAATLEASSGPLADRLLAALAAGQAAGGDSRGQQSAALLVVRERGGYGGFNDRYLDLRVDDHPHSLAELQRLLDLYKLYFDRTPEEELLPLEVGLTREVQGMLQALGHYAGPLHGQYDVATREALGVWAGIENLEERLLPDARLDPVVLDFLRQRHRVRSSEGQTKA